MKPIQIFNPTIYSLLYCFRVFLTLPIRIYQIFISPFLGQRCKYHPSCSNYAIGAIMAKGLIGFGYIIWRLLRCNPWSTGGIDYPPTNNKIITNLPTVRSSTSWE